MTVGIDASPRESDPNVGAWIATVVGACEIIIGADLFAGVPFRPVTSFGGGISSTFEAVCPSKLTDWLGNRLSSDRLGMRRRGESDCIRGFSTGLF